MAFAAEPPPVATFVPVIVLISPTTPAPVTSTRRVPNKVKPPAEVVLNMVVFLPVRAILPVPKSTVRAPAPLSLDIKMPADKVYEERISVPKFNVTDWAAPNVTLS